MKNIFRGKHNLLIPLVLALFFLLIALLFNYLYLSPGNSAFLTKRFQKTLTQKEKIVEKTFSDIKSELDTSDAKSLFNNKNDYLIKLKPKEEQMAKVLSQIELYFRKSDLNIYKVKMIEEEDNFTIISFEFWIFSTSLFRNFILGAFTLSLVFISFKFSSVFLSFLSDSVFSIT